MLDDHIPRNGGVTTDSQYDESTFCACKSPHSGGYAYITTEHSDLDGYTDIDRVKIADGNLWCVSFTRYGQVYQIEYGSEYVDIERGYHEYPSATTMRVTWHIKFKWTHPDTQNLDITTTVEDDHSSTSTTWNVNWRVETRLEVTEFSLSDDRCDPGSNVTASGTVRYYGSQSNVVPPSEECEGGDLKDQVADREMVRLDICRRLIHTRSHDI